MHDRWNIQIFLLLIVSVHLHSLIHNQLWKKLDEVVRYDRSKSFKVIAIGTNRESSYAKYIVHYCDAMPIFYRFRDMTIHWSKICRFTHRSLILSHRKGAPLRFRVRKLVSKNCRVSELPNSETEWSNKHLPSRLSACDRGTDKWHRLCLSCAVVQLSVTRIEDWDNFMTGMKETTYVTTHLNVQA